MERDIHLLETALNVNPWQLGVEKWDDVSSAMLLAYGKNLSRRTLKERILALVDKSRKEELVTK